MSAVEAPWTEEQVEHLKAFQASKLFHPFTCGKRSLPGHVEYADKRHQRDFGMLVPTTKGWICPVCDYTQNWAHDFMLNGEATKMAEFAEEK